MSTTTTRPQDHAATPASATAQDPGVEPIPSRPTGASPLVPILAVIVTAVLVAVVATAWWITSTSRTSSEEATVGTSTPIDEAEALRRLVERGYVPREALGIPDTAPLYTPEELVVLDLVRRGQLPAALLDSEVFVTKRLIARGLVPAGSVR